MGHSFAAGTTDGPGEFNFQQGTTTNTFNRFWELVGGILHKPTKEQEACHAPKPILLDTGYVNILSLFSKKTSSEHNYGSSYLG